MGKSQISKATKQNSTSATWIGFAAVSSRQAAVLAQEFMAGNHVCLVNKPLHAGVQTMMLEPNPIDNNDTRPLLKLVERIDYSEIPELAQIHWGPRMEVERILRELPEDGDQGLSRRLAAHVLLADMYISERCCSAALQSLFHAEAIMLKLVAWAEDWIDPSEVEFLLDRFCELEQFEDARRIAHKTMAILKKRADYQRGDESWYLEIWLNNISCVEQRHKERLQEMKKISRPNFDKVNKETTGLSPAMSMYIELGMRVSET
jgi:hypothetical protein